MEFSKNKSKKDGYNNWCKDCCKKIDRKYRKNNKRKIQKRKKNYYKKNKENIIKKVKKYREQNKDKIRNYMKKYYQKNKDKLKNGVKQYQEKNREKKKEYSKQYQQNHKKEINEYMNKRRKEDINFKLIDNLRDRMCKALKNNSKSAKTEKLLGCSIEFARKHIQNQFKKGMTWNNWGRGWDGKGMEEWHIDHIRPCYSFDLSKESEQARCFHYSNLRPLWAKENLRRKKYENSSQII